MRPDPARRREHQGSVRRAAPRDVPLAHRVSPEQGRRARVATRDGDRHRGVRQRSIYAGPWRVDVTVRAGVTAPLPLARLARAVAAALDAAGAPKPASIGVFLSDDSELGALNSEHMGEAGPTDVLSFPLLPPETFGTTSAAADPLPPGRRPHLGDVVVS